MRSELRRLGLTSPWKIWLAAKNFAKRVWDPTRSDIPHGINALVYEALSNAPAAREAPIVAYSLGQARATGVRAPAMALSVLRLHMALRRPEQFQPAVGLAAEWMRRGAQTRGYSAHRLKDWMDRPVSKVRSRVLDTV